MSKFLLSVLALSLFVFVSCTLVSAQTDGTLSGTITDQNGAVIPGVKITITDPATGLERSLSTNESGSFTVNFLKPSTYSLLAEANGFKRIQLTAINLNVGDRKVLNMQLEAGDVTGVVEVTSDPPLVTTKSDVSTVITREQVENIPLNGRSFQSLFELTPGVNIVPVGGGGVAADGQFSVNGQRTNANYVTVDGVSANTGIASSNGGPIGGQAASGTSIGYTAQGTTASLVALDALQEFRIQTSTFAPEFGRMPGGQISLITRAGTNKFHGTAFEYFRNEAFDATDWFVNATNRDKPPLRQNQFGGTFSGPVWFPRFGESEKVLWNGKDRAFFFFSYEGLRLRLPKAGISTVPSLAARDAAHVDLKPYFNARPIPNGRILSATTAEFAASWSDPSESDSTAIRMDYSVSSNHTVFGRFSRTPSFASERQGASLSSVLTTNQINTSFTAGSTWLLFPEIANDLRVNFTANSAPHRIKQDTFGGAVPLSPTVLAPGGSPESTRFQVSFGLGGSASFGQGSDNRQRQFNIVDGITISKLNHTLKFGVDFRRINPTLIPEGGQRLETLTINTTSLANLAIPRATQYRIFFYDSRGVTVAFDNLSIYAQDTWKVTPRLSLTYGLRWEYVPPPKSTLGENAVTLANIDDPYGGQVHLNPRDTPLYRTRYNNFAPRIGASYLLSQKSGQELVLRAGFGIFHDLGYGIIASAYTQYPFVAIRTCPGGLGCPAGSFVPVPVPPEIRTPPDLSDRPQSITAIDPELEQPFVYQWNIAVERSFGSHQSLSVSWVGAEGRKLINRTNYNIKLQEWSGPQFTPTTVSLNKNLGYSDYRALQVQFQRRLHRNFQSMISYTFGRSRDTASSDGVISTPDERVDFTSDYGYSDYDIRHVLTGAVSFQMPKIRGPWLIRNVVNGWGIDTIFRARTGLPVSVLALVPFNDPRFPISENFAVRANVVPGQPFWSDDPTAPGGRRLNLLAFSVPLPNTQGDLPRNSIHGFGAKQLDVSLRRDFKLKETARLQMRWDVFNITNTPNFNNPGLALAGGSQNPATVGQATSMLGQSLGGLSALYQIGGPRSMQFSAKLIF